MFYMVAVSKRNIWSRSPAGRVDRAVVMSPGRASQHGLTLPWPDELLRAAVDVHISDSPAPLQNLMINLFSVSVGYICGASVIEQKTYSVFLQWKTIKVKEPQRERERKQSEDTIMIIIK